MKNQNTKEWYAEYLGSDHWKDVRARKLEAIGFCCESCSTKSYLQVHHLTYSRVGAERLGDLMVLCGRCHSFAHFLWERSPRQFPTNWIRAMLRHFLTYCHEIENPNRNHKKKREKANHGLNKLPQDAKNYLAKSKREYRERFGK